MVDTTVIRWLHCVTCRLLPGRKPGVVPGGRQSRQHIQPPRTKSLKEEMAMHKQTCFVVAALVAAAASAATSGRGVAQEANSMTLIPGGAAVKWQAGPPDLPKG